MMREYEELVSELRESAEWADRLAVLMGRDVGDSKAPLMRKAADAIEGLLAAVPHWISVEDRLPETISAVLVYCPRNKCTYTAIWSGLKWWHFGGGCSDHVAFPVTYWMPLPEPPKEVE